jgi:hypothetical protein
VRDVTEARELLSSWSRSGEAMSSWCAQRGINWYSLSAYKGWPGRREDGLVEVEVATRATVTTSAVSSSRRYRVVLGSRIVELVEDFDDDVLLRLLRVVEAC